MNPTNRITTKYNINILIRMQGSKGMQMNIKVCRPNFKELKAMRKFTPTKPFPLSFGAKIDTLILFRKVTNLLDNIYRR